MSKFSCLFSLILALASVAQARLDGKNLYRIRNSGSSKLLLDMDMDFHRRVSVEGFSMPIPEEGMSIPQDGMSFPQEGMSFPEEGFSFPGDAGFPPFDEPDELTECDGSSGIIGLVDGSSSSIDLAVSWNVETNSSSADFVASFGASVLEVAAAANLLCELSSNPTGTRKLEEGTGVSAVALKGPVSMLETENCTATVDVNNACHVVQVELELSGSDESSLELAKKDTVSFMEKDTNHLVKGDIVGVSLRPPNNDGASAATGDETERGGSGGSSRRTIVLVTVLVVAGTVMAAAVVYRKVVSKKRQQSVSVSSDDASSAAASVAASTGSNVEML